MLRKVLRIWGLLLLISLVFIGRALAADTPPGTASPTHDPDYQPGEVRFQPALTPQNTPRAAEQTATILPWSKLVFQSYRTGNWEIYLANDDGSGEQALTGHSATDIYPRLNRGATRLAFVSNRTGNYEIFVANADGSAAQRLAAHAANDYNPAWSPDSSRIAFNSYRDGQSELYVMNADGANLTRLTYDAAYDGGAAWSPDGSKLAFRSDRSGGAIWVMNADGSAPTLLAAQPYAENPAWSPDGTQIAYDADGNGDGWQEVWVMNSDGTNQRQVYDPGEATTDAWVRSWSPDGQYVAFTRITFVNYQGNWYWLRAYLDGYAPQTGAFVRLNSSDVEWYPDWQTTDITAPTSQLNPLPTQSPAPFQVSWSGADVGQAGMRSFDVQVKDGAANVWTDWQVRMSSTSAAYSGIGGHTYYFRARARDNAHNVEAWPVDYEAVTTIEALAPNSVVMPLPDYTHNNFEVRWNGNDPGGSGIQHYDVQYRDGMTGNWTNWLTNTLKTTANFTGVMGHTYYFRSRAIDKAQNIEAWSQNDGDTATTLYRWRVTGIVRDNRSVFQANAVITTTPAAFVSFPSNHQGEYAAYVTEETEVYRGIWGKPGYAELPLTTLGNSQDAQYDIVLPPTDNVIQDWGFENASLTHYWGKPADSMPALVRDTRHTGDYAVLFGCATISTSTTSGGGYGLQMATDTQDNVYVVWQQNKVGNYDIYFAQSSNGVWSESVNLSNDAVNSGSPLVGVDDDGIVHVVWKDATRVYYTQRTVQGIWTTPITISGTTDASQPPQFAVESDGVVHVVWFGNFAYEMYYARRETSGIWSEPYNFLNGLTGEFPELAVDDAGTVHIWWNGGISTPGKYYTYRTQEGVWLPPENVLENTAQSLAADLAIGSDGTAHAILYNTLDYDGLYYKQHVITDTWSTPYTITTDLKRYHDFSILTDPMGGVHLVWAGSESYTSTGIYYTHQLADGEWANPISVNEAPTETLLFQADADENGGTHIVWDYQGNTYYTQVERDSKQVHIQNLTPTTKEEYSNTPFIEVGSKSVHIVWLGGYPGPIEIHHISFPKLCTSDSTITQRIFIPDTMLNPTLSFLYQMHNASPGERSFEIEVNTGITTTTIFSESTDVNIWTHRWVDMSRWSGQEITVSLATQQSQNPLLSFGVYLDEVTLGSSYPDLWGHGCNLNTLPGEQIVCILTYGNCGGAPANNVRVTDILPAHLTFVSADPMPVQGSTFLPPLTWNLGTLPANSGLYTIILTATVAPTVPMFSTLTGTVSITSTSPELELANNTAVIHVLVAHQLYLPLVTKH